MRTEMKTVCSIVNMGQLDILFESADLLHIVIGEDLRCATSSRQCSRLPALRDPDGCHLSSGEPDALSFLVPADSELYAAFHSVLLYSVPASRPAGIP